jgi:hypothetical protein
MSFAVTYTQLMFPQAPIGMSLHIRGVGAWFEALGPTAFRCGIYHKLFDGFLPLLVWYSKTLVERLDVTYWVL